MEFIFAGATIDVVVAITAVENIVTASAGEGVVTAIAKECISTIGAIKAVVGGVAVFVGLIEACLLYTSDAADE